MTEALIGANVLCALISAKWALDLGFSEGRQLLYLIGGLLLGPLMLLILYIRLQYKHRAEKKLQKQAS
ncbi:MAG: hypothetical protein OEY25_09080 [Candidatus Aminicenantes bacterium]|nr:hypothetical protein [Candidatus Aminicenantes bacterium]MDH5705090.1 hypothetical protein [Candidatus Aminicenantes bacterium]